MEKPPSIYIHLTPGQVKQLKAHFDYVRHEAARDSRGMLVAQVWDAASFFEGPARMRVGFLENDVASHFVGAAKDRLAEDALNS